MNKNNILLNERDTRTPIISKNLKKICKTVEPGYDNTNNKNLYYKPRLEEIFIFIYAAGNAKFNPNNSLFRFIISRI